MGGKGQKRRQKNYLAAHGGDTRMPPPPKAKELDAIPSKLRRIMDFQNNSNAASIKDLIKKEEKGKNVDDNGKKRGGIEEKKKDQKVSDSNDQYELKPPNTVEISEETENKKKRKKKKDLLMYLDAAASHLSKKKRKKEFFDARKKKSKRPKVEDIREFPGPEKVRFGEVVAAPPKLSFPKVSKSALGASQERLRLQAIDAYRNRKGWVSRPGSQISSVTESEHSRHIL